MASRRLQLHLRIFWPEPTTCGLIVLWGIWQMFPFFPLLRVYKLRELAAQLPVWDFRGVEFGDIMLAAVALYAFIARAPLKSSFTALLVSAVLFPALLAQSLIAGLTLSSARLAAAAAGLMVATLVWRPRRARWIALAGVLGGWAVFRELAPFPFPISRIPIDAPGSVLPSPFIRVLAGRIFLYGSTMAALKCARKTS